MRCDSDAKRDLGCVTRGLVSLPSVPPVAIPSLLCPKAAAKWSGRKPGEGVGKSLAVVPPLFVDGSDDVALLPESPSEVSPSLSLPSPDVTSLSVIGWRFLAIARFAFRSIVHSLFPERFWGTTVLCVVTVVTVVVASSSSLVVAAPLPAASALRSGSTRAATNGGSCADCSGAVSGTSSNGSSGMCR